MPLQADRYDPAIHGRGEAGIRSWRREAVEWLDGDPDRRLDVGPVGDLLDVFRESIRLLQAWRSA